MQKIILNPKYLKLNEFVNSIRSDFHNLSHCRLLHDGRNKVKYVEILGEKLVVKSYERVSFVNRLLYGRLRQSKAVRAFRYAERLIELGIDTPRPVAAVDVYEGGVLRQSFFVSEYSDYQSAEVVNSYPPMGENLHPLMDALAKFIFDLHNVGVLHRDLNITNILYRKSEKGEYLFQLIDINRMDFKRRISRRKRIKNMRRLSCSPAAYAYILERYAELLLPNESTFQLQGLIARLLFEYRQRAKQSIKLII